jgi:hypothetical protein
LRDRVYKPAARLAVLWTSLCSVPAWASADYYVESPSTPDREQAEAHLETIPSLGAGIQPRVIRRFRVGEGWAYVIRVDALEQEQAHSVATALSHDGDPGVVYRRIGSRTIRVMETEAEPEEDAIDAKSDQSSVSEDAPTLQPLDPSTLAGEAVEADSADLDFEPRLQSTVSVLSRALRAHGGEGGGASQIQGAGSVTFTYDRTVATESETLVVRHEFVRWGDGMRLAVEILEGDGVNSLAVVDRSGQAWLTTNGETISRDPSRTTEVLADYSPADILGVSMRVAEQIQSGDDWSEMSLRGTQASPGGEQIVIENEEGSGRGLQSLHFDAVHSWLVSAEWHTLEGVIRMGFEDYVITEDGLVYPSRLTVWRDSAIMERIVVHDLQLNQAVDPTLFQAPESASPK